MEKYFRKFAKTIKTKENLILSLEDIADAKQLVFKIKRDFLSNKIKNFSNDGLKAFFQKLEKEEIVSQDSEEQYALLEKLEKYLCSFKEVKLSIAFYPDSRTINKINQWIEKETGRKIILDIIVNPKIVGGAIIEYQGKWGDFTLAKEIDKLISRKDLITYL